MSLVLSQATEVLSRTPATVRALLAGLDDERLTADEGPETFSPRDVVGHLIVGEETDWIPRLRIILDHGPRRPFTPFDRFGFKQKYGRMPIDGLLERFAQLREENLDQLRALALSPVQSRASRDPPRACPGPPALYYENRGDGTFAEATDARGLTDTAPAYGFGVVATDYDNDG